MVRRVLDVIADVLTLLAVTVAGIAHVWFAGHLESLLLLPHDAQWAVRLRDLAMPNLIGSGLCLGLLVILVGLSLLVHAGPMLRRVWNLGMFATAAGSMLFQVVLITIHGRTRLMNLLDEPSGGLAMLIVGLAATGFAIFFSLARMIWTMPAFKSDSKRAGTALEPGVLPNERTLPTALPEDPTLLEGAPNEETRRRRSRDE